MAWLTAPSYANRENLNLKRSQNCFFTAKVNSRYAHIDSALFHFAIHFPMVYYS